MCELQALATRDMVLVAEPVYAERAEISRDKKQMARDATQTRSFARDVDAYAVAVKKKDAAQRPS